MKAKVPLRVRRAVRDRLWLAFEQAGLSTQEAVATRTGISRATLSAWSRRDPVLPGTAHLIRLTETLQLSPTWIVTGEGAMLVGGGTSNPSLKEELENLAVRHLIAVGVPSSLAEIWLNATLSKGFITRTRVPKSAVDLFLRFAEKSYATWFNSVAGRDERIRAGIKTPIDDDSVAASIGNRKSLPPPPPLQLGRQLLAAHRDGTSD